MAAAGERGGRREQLISGERHRPGGAGRPDARLVLERIAAVRDLVGRPCRDRSHAPAWGLAGGARRPDWEGARWCGCDGPSPRSRSRPW